jgi:hypothetical protein
MPTPKRALTNDYRDCKLIKLDPNDPSSPFVVTQEGYVPGDPNSRMRLFYLQRDGQWIDEVARSTRPDREAGDIVFETSSEAVKMLSSLLGAPFVRELPVTDADIQTYMSKAKTVSSPEAAFREFLARYRAAKGR